MKPARRCITIREIPGKGWLWLEHGRQFGSLAGAIKAVNKDARAIARHTGAVITVITYEPVTVLGSAVVKAMTQSDKR